MTGYIVNTDYQETIEYHGNTTIERTRMQNGHIERVWINFDSIEEAVEFFDEFCA